MTRTVTRLSIPGLVFALILPGIVGCGHGPKVQHGNTEVYYSDGASKAVADRLGDYLNSLWTAVNEPRSVQIKKAGDKYQFRMVVKKGYENNEEFLNEAPLLAARLARDVFEDAEVEFHICDDRLNTLKMLAMRDDLRHGLLLNKIEVFYSATVPKDEAEAFLRQIKLQVGNDETARSFTLERRNNIVAIRLVVNKERLNEAALQAALRQDGRNMSAQVFKGTPVEIGLCDSYLNVLQVLKP